ncbi:MAG: hypothetical protein E6H78_15775, partial [Betaproteobacteria bacterium]
PKVPGLTYVGRLDVMTSGLLLLTTDGAAAHRLMHPRYEVPRTYWLGVHGADAAAIRAALAQRIVIDGRPVRVVESRVRPQGKSVEIELTLAEGPGRRAAADRAPRRRSAGSQGRMAAPRVLRPCPARQAGRGPLARAYPAGDRSDRATAWSWLTGR